MGDAREVPARYHCLPDNEHAEQEEHHIDIDRMEGIGRRDLPGDEDRDRSAQHDLPDLQAEPADLPDRDEQEDGGKYR